ncbi:hypothetical protein A0H81_05150 [Grifola frondosa]|uniref:F-box domain-containing protein n=1 Tax=Grifola frondosa TaxID=5627 RepID=A0A1C7MC91_GRIFR|nr:hypothetical protein A0H81_05150 [Grifola frondosa]
MGAVVPDIDRYITPISNTMESIPSGGALPFDILIHVFELLRNEYASLYNCCLVSQVTKVAASKVLYGQVTYSPAYSPVLRLKRRDELSEGFFHSARLPHNSVHVLKVEISGYLSTRPAPLDRLAISLREALSFSQKYCLYSQTSRICGI